MPEASLERMKRDSELLFELLPATTAGGRLVGMAEPRSRYERIYAVVRRIPAGAVATYGQVAAVAGLPGQARQVGYALNALPEGSEVPWQRVINAQGRVSPRSEPGWEGFQRRLLEGEGIVFDRRGRVDLERHRWDPDAGPGGRGGRRQGRFDW